MRMRIFAAILWALPIAAAIHTPPAAAQDYSSRPVRIVMPIPVGSSPDIRTRIIAHQLTTMWGRQVVVENRPGAG